LQLAVPVRYLWVVLCDHSAFDMLRALRKLAEHALYVAKRFDTIGIRSSEITYGIRKEFQLGRVHQLCAFR
jgi:hypothetical protein